MAATAQTLRLTDDMDAKLWFEDGVEVPDWVVNPEDPKYKKQFEEANGTIILPSEVLVRSHFSIFKCLVVPGSVAKGSVAKGNMPNIDVLTSTGNHSGILMCSKYFPESDDNIKPHTKAYFMFRPMVPTEHTWCSSFKRISNSIGVAQLAYGKFIEVFEKYFVTGTFTSTQLSELFQELNASINEGRDIFTNKLRHLLEKFRKKKDKEGGFFFKKQDKETYDEFTYFITDVLRNDGLKDVGETFPVGSLASLELTGEHDTYTSRNDGGAITDTFKRAAYNSFIIITITTENGEIITVHLDINRDSFLSGLSHSPRISFWNGQLIEYTTTDDFIKEIIVKLDAAVASASAVGVHIDSAAVKMAREALSNIMDRRRTTNTEKFGSNTVITTGCQVPMLFYFRPRQVEIVFPGRLRASYESVVGMDPDASKEKGYTGYFILCPPFIVPFGVHTSNNILFFCNYPSMNGVWFNFPDYDYVRSGKVIGSDEGVFQSSLDIELPESPRMLLPSPSPSPPSLAQADTSEHHPIDVDVADVKVADVKVADVEVPASVVVPNQPSFFRSIFNKCVSYFFSAKVGDIKQTQTNFIDDVLDVDELLIRNALDLARDVDSAEGNLLVHAAFHASDAVLDLIIAFDLDTTYLECYNLLEFQSKTGKIAAAEAARSAYAVSRFDMAKKCLHVLAFAVRLVAYICAREIVKGIHHVPPELELDTGLLKTLDLLNSGDFTKKLDEIFQVAISNNDLVIDKTTRMLEINNNHKRTHGLGHGDLGHGDLGHGSLGYGGLGDGGYLRRAKSAKIGGQLRSRRYLHRVSRKRRQRTLKKKNIPRKYSKYSGSTRTRSIRSGRRHSYSRKISNKY
jgi:hypothetical protein